MGLRSWLASRRPPPEIRGLLDRDEPVLAWGRTEAGEPVVATRKGLWVPGGPPRRIGWETVHTAGWDSGRFRLVEGVEVEPDVVADGPVTVLRLAEAGGLPAAVHERVTASVAYTVHHQLPGLGGVRIVGRRVPGRDGVSYAARYDDGTDRQHPAVVAATEQLLAQARDIP